MTTSTDLLDKDMFMNLRNCTTSPFPQDISQKKLKYAEVTTPNFHRKMFSLKMTNTTFNHNLLTQRSCMALLSGRKFNLPDAGGREESHKTIIYHPNKQSE
jgi:hypothetical protein